MQSSLYELLDIVVCVSDDIKQQPPSAALAHRAHVELRICLYITGLLSFTQCRCVGVGVKIVSISRRHGVPTDLTLLLDSELEMPVSSAIPTVEPDVTTTDIFGHPQQPSEAACLAPPEPGVPGIEDSSDDEANVSQLEDSLPSAVRAIIDKLVHFVARNGSNFEATVRRREKGNPKFAFLLPWNEYHWYYRQKLAEALGEDGMDRLLGSAGAVSANADSAIPKATIQKLLPQEPGESKNEFADRLAAGDGDDMFPGSRQNADPSGPLKVIVTRQKPVDLDSARQNALSVVSQVSETKLNHSQEDSTSDNSIAKSSQTLDQLADYARQGEAIQQCRAAVEVLSSLEAGTDKKSNTVESNQGADNKIVSCLNGAEPKALATAQAGALPAQEGLVALTARPSGLIIKSNPRFVASTVQSAPAAFKEEVNVTTSKSAKNLQQQEIPKDDGEAQSEQLSSATGVEVAGTDDRLSDRKAQAANATGATSRDRLLAARRLRARMLLAGRSVEPQDAQQSKGQGTSGSSASKSEVVTELEKKDLPAGSVDIEQGKLRLVSGGGRRK